MGRNKARAWGDAIETETETDVNTEYESEA